METYRSFEIANYAGEAEVLKGDAPWTALPVRVDIDVNRREGGNVETRVCAAVPGSWVLGEASTSQSPVNLEAFAEELASEVVKNYSSRAQPYPLSPEGLIKFGQNVRHAVKDGITELLEG